MCSVYITGGKLQKTEQTSQQQDPSSGSGESAAIDSDQQLKGNMYRFSASLKSGQTFTNRHLPWVDTKVNTQFLYHRNKQKMFVVPAIKTLTISPLIEGNQMWSQWTYNVNCCSAIATERRRREFNNMLIKPAKI